MRFLVPAGPLKVEYEAEVSLTPLIIDPLTVTELAAGSGAGPRVGGRALSMRNIRDMIPRQASKASSPGMLEVSKLKLAAPAMQEASSPFRRWRWRR